MIEHEIDTGDAEPVCQQMRCISKEFEGRQRNASRICG